MVRWLIFLQLQWVAFPTTGATKSARFKPAVQLRAHFTLRLQKRKRKLRLLLRLVRWSLEMAISHFAQCDCNCNCLQLHDW